MFKNLVIFSSLVGDGIFIGLLASISMVVNAYRMFRAFLFIYAQLLIPIQALWSGLANSLCQLFIHIFANIFLVTRLVH